MSINNEKLEAALKDILHDALVEAFCSNDVPDALFVLEDDILKLRDETRKLFSKRIRALDKADKDEELEAAMDEEFDWWEPRFKKILEKCCENLIKQIDLD